MIKVRMQRPRSVPPDEAARLPRDCAIIQRCRKTLSDFNLRGLRFPRPRVYTWVFPSSRAENRAELRLGGGNLAPPPPLPRDFPK